MKRVVLFVPVLLLVLTSLAAGQSSRTYTIDDLLKARAMEGAGESHFYSMGYDD